MERAEGRAGQPLMSSAHVSSILTGLTVGMRQQGLESSSARWAATAYAAARSRLCRARETASGEAPLSHAAQGFRAW
jgi:hypothetical protein